MAEKSNNIRTRLSDFISYRKEQLTGRKRNAFEKNLQKDPFAEEAQEGFETISGNDLTNDIKNLRSRLNKRIRTRSRKVYYRIAASIAVLMIISSVFVFIERNRMTTEFQQSEEGIIMEIRKSDPIFKEPASEEEEQHPTLKIKEESKTEQNIDYSSEERTIEEKPSVNEPADNRKLSGRSFRKADESDFIPGAKSEAQYAESDNISAKPELAYKSVLPSIYERSAAKTDSITADYIPAQPAAGMDDYEKYIRQNIQRPDSLSGQRFVVIAGFLVHSDGTVTGIHIIRSPGPEFSNEATRLISTGPAWKPAIRHGTPVDDSISIRIVFR